MSSDPQHIKSGAPGVRGISYPAIPLEAAVKRARQLWDAERKNPAPLEAVANHWGYSPSSSGVRTTVAALLAFGLISDQGSGENRKVQLTPRGLDIVLETPERHAALIEAVASPKIYSELLALWPPDNLPSDQTIKVHLLRHKNFNPKAVDGFVQDFRDSVGFSGLAKAGNMPSFPAPENEGMPASQLAAGERNHVVRSSEHRSVPPSAPPITGERQWFEIDLAHDVKCRLLLSGQEIGVEEIDTLIEFLEFQKRVYAKKRGVEIGAAAGEQTQADGKSA
jgi:hypothetical protein